MGTQQKPQVTQEEVQQATALWTDFTYWMKWGVIAVIIIVALMAIFLTP